VLGEKQIIITTDDSLNYTVKSALVDNQSEKPQSLEEAVRSAIKGKAAGYKIGETATEGHIILGTEVSDKAIRVYTIASIGNFGFENGIFTKISGSGAIPTVITLSNEEKDKYALLEFKEPEDGSGYTNSIKKMFPFNLHNKVLNSNKYESDLVKQQEIQAEEYLKSIGRTAKVSAAYVDKILVNINVEASNKLFAGFSKYDVFINSCPYWIGTVEQVEGGIRYIYETSQSKTSDGYDIVSFKKTNVDGNVIKEIKYKIVGSEPQLNE
jgi:bla regulator protein BlaR1